MNNSMSYMCLKVVGVLRVLSIRSKTHNELCYYYKRYVDNEVSLEIRYCLY